MRLNKEQLTQIFNAYLKECFLHKSTEHLPIFETVDGGKALTHRLFKVLRRPDLKHLVVGDSIYTADVCNLAEDFLEEHKKIYLYGLNYWFTKDDLHDLRKVYESLNLN